MPGGIHPPLSVLEQWAKIANPEHPSQVRGWGLAILCIVLFSATFVVVVARLWARVRVKNTAGLDDILIMVAMIPTAGLALSTALASRSYGFGRHAWDLSPELSVDSRKITMVMEATYIVSTALTKISILLFYKRMSKGAITTFFRTVVWASIAFVAAYAVVFLCTLFFGCSPINAFWQQVDLTWEATHIQNVDYHCLNEPANLLAASSVSIFQDFLACGLPTMLFWKLQLPRRQKIALGAIFGVGFFLCITGVLRIYYIHKIFYETYDTTWAAEDVWIWTMVEAHLAIICASAPAIKVFFKAYFTGSFTGSLSRTWRQRSYQRKGYAGQEDSAYGTRSTTFADGAHKDVELGAINITSVVDVDSSSMKSVDGADKSSDTSLTEEIKMKGPSMHVMRPSNHSAPWLYIDPPSTRKI